MIPALRLILSGAAGYLIGAIPTGVLICRLLVREDVRQYGSGHTGGLNVSRVAGPWGGGITAVLDALLGLVAAASGTWIAGSCWGATIAGVMAIVGHDWSVYIGFDGGIGLSKLAGTLLYASPIHALEGLALVISLWFALVVLARCHRARTTILAMLAVGPLLWLLGMPPHGVLLGALGGLAVAIKTLPDWNRAYARADT